MNSKCLINFNFMKEMFKKSKGPIVLFLCLVPIFTFLSLYTFTSGYRTNVISVPEIGLINFLGSYVIPVILSFCLFNYIYKKASVDFINSMPISKKTIFLSNTFLGIILILIMQIINTLGICLFNLLKPEIILSMAMLWDLFVVSTLTYIFVFTCTNLAMCLSGNYITQIALTCLILFFVPFLINYCNNDVFSLREGVYELEANCLTYELHRMDAFHETMPYKFIKIAFSDGDNIYDIISIVKMILLSIVYIVLGSYLYKYRKFENVGESFKSNKIHEFVKALTMFPMFGILQMTGLFENEYKSPLIFVMGILIAYFFIFDVITSKKIKLRNSIVYLVIIFATLYIITSGIHQILCEKNEFGNYIEKTRKTYTIEDVESISICPEVAYSYQVNQDILKYRITDREIIKDLLDDEFTEFATIKCNMKDGNEVYLDYFISSKVTIGEEDEEGLRQMTLKNLYDILAKDQNYMNELKSLKSKNGIMLLSNGIRVDGELYDKLNNYFINNIDLNDHRYGRNYYAQVVKHIYSNHALVHYTFFVEEPELINEIAKVYNEDMKKNILNAKEYASNFNISEVPTGGAVYLDPEDSKKILDFIKNDNQEFDSTKRFVIIDGYLGFDYSGIYMTNDEEIIKLFDELLVKQQEEEAQYGQYYKDFDYKSSMVDPLIVENTVTNEVLVDPEMANIND